MKDSKYLNKLVKVKSKNGKYAQNFLVIDENDDSLRVVHEELVNVEKCKQWVKKENVLIQPEDGYIHADYNRKVCSVVETFNEETYEFDYEIKVDEKLLKLYDKSSKKIPDWKPTRDLKPFNEVKKLFIDIETSGLNPEKDRIFYIGLKATGYNFKENYKLITHFSEKKILEDLVETLKKYKPEILIGFNSLQFDIPFIIRRCELLKVKHDFKVSDYQVKVKTAQVFGEPIEFQACYLNNTSLIDIYHQVLILDNVKRVLTSHSLKQSVLQMGLRKDQRLELDYLQIQKCWDDGDLDTIEEYLKYDLDDTELLTNYLLPSVYYQQIFVPGMNIQRLATTGNGTKWQAVLEEQYPNIGKGVIQPDNMAVFGGGYTVGYAGLYRNVSKVDVASLYPSIMLLYGITSSKDEMNKLLGIIKYLKEERLILKKLAETDLDADQKQGSLKVLLNSAFGLLGTNGVGYNDYQAAALVTAYGRRIAKLMVESIEDSGGTIVEVDTDGVMFSCVPGDNDRIFRIVKNLMPNGIELEHEWQADAVFIPPVEQGSKQGIRKNYLVFLKNGKVKATGKFRKRDICETEKNFTIDYIKHYLKSPDKAEEFYRNLIAELQSGKFNVEKLKITRKIRKKEIELLKLGKTGQVISFYETEKGKGIKGDYSIAYYQDRFKKMHDELLSIIDSEFLTNNQLMIDNSFINNHAVQLSLFVLQ